MNQASKADYMRAYDALVWVDEGSMEARQLRQAIDSGDRTAMSAAVFAVKAGFNPSQARGVTGQWSSGGGGGATGGGSGGGGRGRRAPAQGGTAGGGGAHPLQGVTQARRARAAAAASSGGLTFHEHLVLYALRHHGGWVPENAPSLLSSPHALEHLLRQGLIERRPGPHGTFEYRIKPGAAGGSGSRGTSGGGGSSRSSGAGQ